MSVFATMALAACTAASDAPPVSTPPPQAAPAPAPVMRDPAEPSWPGERTNILSQTDADRLLHNKGATLQWIDWDRRGTAVVTPEGQLWRLRAAQSARDGKGRLILDGAVLEVGEGYFTFRGRIRIADTPDPGRVCDQTKTWHFAITQNRRYYRLREFEWCDGLTDYIDIYF
ncbi:MAG: hypothetical protein KDE32_09095 [Novosphingobium sp.]|nr:hypothetical protein [Novosphingobium sp.]